MSSPEQQLKRFLHYGEEIAVYIPGKRAGDKYERKELPFIDEMISGGKHADIVSCIVKAFSDGYSAHPEMIVYALAYCAKQKTSPQLTAAAYKACKTICETAENLFLFVKYATKLSPSNSAWGSGFRKVVKEWYLSKDAKTLAQIVAKRKKYHGWSHKDLMKLVHLKSSDPAQEAVIKCVLYGVARAKKESQGEGTTEVLNYMQSIHDFRHMTDEQQAARTLESLRLTVDHVPTPLLKSKEIWMALVGNIPLVINRLERLGQRKLLDSSSPLFSRIQEALRNEQNIAESHLHPAEVFLAFTKYVESSKYKASKIAQRKQRKPENATGADTGDLSSHQPPVPPEPGIVDALSKLFQSTSKLFLSPTGLRYGVVINQKRFLKDIKCYKCPCLSSSHAVVLTCLCLVSADRNVSVSLTQVWKKPSQSGGDGAGAEAPDVKGKSKVMEDGHCLSLSPLPLRPEMCFSEARRLLHTATFTGLAPWTDVFDILSEEKTPYDVVLFVSEFPNKHYSSERLVASLNKYRTEAGVPNAKLINLTLCGPLTRQSSVAVSSNDPGILEIYGFDECVPRIIEGFSRGAF